MSKILAKTLGSLGKNCLALKRKHDMSEKDVERKAGCAQKTFNNIVNGTHNPTLKSIVRLAEAFKVEPWQLLRDDFDPELPDSNSWNELNKVLQKMDDAEIEAFLEDYSKSGPSDA